MLIEHKFGLLFASMSLVSLISLESIRHSPQELTITQIAQAQTEVQISQREPDVLYIPTPQEVVDEMLKLAQVNKDDVIYDLGSGDGRIPITAAQRYGSRGIGIDISPERIQEANENAREAGVTDRVEFLQQDLFASDFTEATVVTLYLLPELNLRLRPQLLKQLKPGTRIVSHAFDMGDWEPERVVLAGEGSTIYLWIVPEEIPANLRSNISN
ncbi:Methyltransferase type 11 [Hyella patelloides LEGE 07179]|uniref:Methyltransferase type 11 n=1 Tax=Hyella patelloides LEGE 07179 TaxID=945734 RepID=A0A563VZJ3_9CYAN|nr:methyltransferase domain-containing protein [Hyella patelloides]VEP16840.1 Methyltransferase type 11 [Hyella patelloides LEGE 07179]